MRRVIEVPLGTVVSLRKSVELPDGEGPGWNDDGSKPRFYLELLADLSTPHASVIAAQGGRGGRGNAALRTRQDRLVFSTVQTLCRRMHQLNFETH